MGGIIGRERRHATARKPSPKPAPKPEMEEVGPEAVQSKSPSRVDIVKTESRSIPCPKRVVEYNEDLTEEMIEGLTLSSSDTAKNKAKKKSELEMWLQKANYTVTPDNDALARHQRSMEALRVMLQAKKERSLRPRSEHGRSTSHSKGSRPRKASNVEVLQGVPSTA